MVLTGADGVMVREVTDDNLADDGGCVEEGEGQRREYVRRWRLESRAIGYDDCE